jgi:hypothetical protein
MFDLESNGSLKRNAHGEITVIGIATTNHTPGHPDGQLDTPRFTATCHARQNNTTYQSLELSPSPSGNGRVHEGLVMAAMLRRLDTHCEEGKRSEARRERSAGLEQF